MDKAIKEYETRQREDLKNAIIDLGRLKEFLKYKKEKGLKESKNDIDYLNHFENQVEEQELVLNSLYNDKYNLSCEINN